VEDGNQGRRLIDNGVLSCFWTSLGLVVPVIVLAYFSNVLLLNSVLSIVYGVSVVALVCCYYFHISSYVFLTIYFLFISNMICCIQVEGPLKNNISIFMR